MLVTSLPKTVTAFEPGRSFFQLTWLRTEGKWPLMQEPANRHMTDSTENVIQNNFYRFLVDFSDYARTAENPLIDPLKDQRNNQKRDKKCTKIAGFTVRRKTVRFKSCTKVCSLKSFGWINLIHLDEYGPGQVDLDQGRFVRNSRSVSKTDSKSTEKKLTKP